VNTEAAVRSVRGRVVVLRWRSFPCFSFTFMECSLLPYAAILDSASADTGNQITTSCYIAAEVVRQHICESNKCI
jgi:hypothetical protein